MYSCFNVLYTKDKLSQRNRTLQWK